MKLVIFGSSGETGTILVQQAIKQNYAVTAFARDPQKIKISHTRLKIVQGDILDYASLLPALQGQDAVISALGIRVMGKNTIISEGTKNIIRAMEEKNVKRFICMSSVGIGESRAQQKSLGFLFNYIMIPLVLRNMFDDKEIQENYIKNSSLDWIIVRPVILTNNKKTGHVNIFSATDTAIQARISRADVADFLLSQINKQSHIKEAVSIS